MRSLNFLTILVVTYALASNVNAQQVENLRIKNFEDKVNLIYDISHEKTGQIFKIDVLCSDNGGQSFDVDIHSLSGDYGRSVEGGKDKIIIWDVFKDHKVLKGNNYVFKLMATPEKIENSKDHVEGLQFELVECYKKGNQIICALKITNQGALRDLKMANRLARIYDFKNNKIESHNSKLGNISGSERYSEPTLTFQPQQTSMAFFSFDIPANFSNRIKMLEFGVEVLEITYGLDLKVGNIQFRDISFYNTKQAAKTELISQSTRFDFGQETSRSVDTKPPTVTFTSPALSKEKPIVVHTEEIILQGNVIDNTEVFEITINGMNANLKDNGSFDTDIYLVEGDNNVFVRAVDKFNNTIEETYPIQYKPLQKKDQRQSAAGLPVGSKPDATIPTEGKYYALIIGVNQYPDPQIMNLEQPAQDAEKLYQTLNQHYSFDKENITLLKNPTRENIISELDRLNKIITEDDNLLVFYAGHGYWDEKDEIGYWLPSDATQENTANWIRNSTVRDYLRTVKTKHTLLIADACFSGGIFKTRKAFSDAPKSIQKLYEYPSRKAMTSGTLQEVPDKSVFLLYLNKRLTENIQPYISAEEVFSSFKIAVLNNSPNIPQYGEIKDTGDEGGDFIFVKRN